MGAEGIIVPFLSPWVQKGASPLFLPTGAEGSIAPVSSSPSQGSWIAAHPARCSQIPCLQYKKRMGY